jgi:hypothetical protein
MSPDWFAAVRRLPEVFPHMILPAAHVQQVAGFPVQVSFGPPRLVRPAAERPAWETP